MKNTDTVRSPGNRRFWPTLWLGWLVLALSFVLPACKPGGTAAKPTDVDYYTCTMHPSVKKQSPTDKCPICSMDLTAVMKKPAGTNGPAAAHTGHHHEAMAGDTNALAKTGDEAPSEFALPVQRLQQIGVTYAAVEKMPLRRNLRAVGMVAYDKQRHWDYVARVEGYVKQLSVFSRGELVEQDAPLLTIYSPELLNTQTEFVDLLKMRDEARAKGSQAVLASTERLVASAKQRLHLWNVGDAQIAELERSRQPQETLTLRSPFRGVVQDIGVDQGRKVMNGDHLVDIADLSVVWVWAQFYQDELPLLKRGVPVAITTSTYPGEKFPGKIVLIDPFLSDAQRTARVRVDVDNADLRLRPEMYVDAELTVDMGEGLAVPVGAVLPTGRHNIAFVEKGEGRLEPRYVELGGKFGDFYEVKSGLKEHERVVTSANFLIDAEAKVQGALKSW